MKKIFLTDGLYNIIIDDNYEVFEFKNEAGHIKHIFSKRAIDTSIEGKVYYDLIPLDGFGGPIVVSCRVEQRWDLIYDYIQAFQDYCLENNIVCEEIEFNSALGNVHDFLEWYEVEYVRDNFGIDLANLLKHDVHEQSEDIRDSIDSDLNYRVLESVDAIKIFEDFVKKTNETERYIDENYFKLLIDEVKEEGVVIELRFQDTVIGMCWEIIRKESSYYHCLIISAYHQNIDVDKLLKCTTNLCAKEKRLKKMWDSRKSNKSPCVLETVETQIFKGRKIWNEKIYQQLCDATNIDKRTEFFPAYRK